MIKTAEFEGPVELLLQLIEERKMDISQVSLSAVADSYMERLKNIEEFPVGEVANFILVASTLMLIKSLTLVPNLEVSQEEQASIEELEARLKLYQQAKERARALRSIWGKSLIYFREPSHNTVTVFAPTTEITKVNLLDAIKNLIAAIPVKEILPEAIVKKVISLEEMMERLVTRIQKSIKMKFSEFANGNGDRTGIIVSFLAVLELVKRGSVMVRQGSHFGDIEIEHGTGAEN